jgi:hypothetical protein
MGHYFMHKKDIQFSFCNPNDPSMWENEPVNRVNEQEANQFASAFLMPRNMFIPLCDTSNPSMQAIACLGDVFNTSLTATSIRYVECSEHPLFLVASQNGIVKWFSESSIGKEIRTERNLFFELGAKLDPDTGAGKLLISGGVTGKCNKVPISSWLTSTKPNQSITIREDSLSMLNYGMILSLLWINEDDLETDDDETEEEEGDEEYVPSWKRKRDW